MAATQLKNVLTTKLKGFHSTMTQGLAVETLSHRVQAESVIDPRRQNSLFLTFLL